ncbi:energy-coupling factor transporter ATPase [Salisediminibacterium halotolerans]|uniref:energy-coupling factor transporter ATPase n=1 Tax=Salisediminibacterium halotolerans TaxID=517425 RepID=UPI000EACA86F|nr:energy-coupling factor transporter ATPase [Salisediminibacterium halotolerans]RLJ73105.1 energy-coupling factor transport system ATP-binding protein [Actinophytocola xinjiangensis]RPE86527.1 energy-coupling factor transport system ATP-binding protein [Salisediminibacterium halotolerans]TWG33902.1 energy-coupling factor transport system ATP-binding protein [Salisediminibacterium halotolerans]GEL07440.1 energy-coupling factor transporter ATP-binding protein EcfA1 [Salisediminibacterium halotol
MAAVIEVKEVSFRYGENDADVLKNVNVTIEQGEWVSILGPNGSGKSTLAKFFNALLVPGKGEVVSCGLSTGRERNWTAVRRQVGMVFQNPDNQIVAPTVQDDVAFGLENAGIPFKEMEKRVAENIDQLGLNGLENEEPHRLSGGQKQRVAIAGAMALHPRVLVFDEAMSMLDPNGKQEVLQMMHTLRREHDMTIISITHDVEEALSADRLLVLYEGKVLASGSPSAVLEDSALLEEAKLMPPFARRLQQKLAGRGIFLPAAVLRDEELVQQLCRLKQTT